ncbi:MAG: XdhC family protein [Collinsella sp.]
MEKLDVVNAALAALRAGETCELVVVAGTAGSSPRGVGAWMAVFADGSQAGTIGGGKIELFALDEARELLSAGQSRLVRYTMGGENSDTGMICGGAICLCYLHLDATRHRCSRKLPTSWSIGASATSSSILSRLSRARSRAMWPSTMARNRAAPLRAAPGFRWWRRGVRSPTPTRPPRFPRRTSRRSAPRA